MLLNPINDFIFRCLMRDTETLEAFLSALLLPTDLSRLAGMEITNDAALNKEILENKTGRLDIKISTPGKLQLNIEIQRSNQYNMEKRTLFYWSKLFLENIKSGEKYKDLPKTITINILDFKYLHQAKVHSTFHLWEDAQQGYCLTDLLEVHFIELPVFRELAEKALQTNPLHRWLFFLDHTQAEAKRKELAQMDTGIAKALEKLEYLSSDKEARALHDAREDALREQANLIDGAKEEGREEGREEEIKEDIRFLLADFAGYESYREIVEKALSEETDLAKLRRLLKAAARSQNVHEFIQKMKDILHA